MTWIVKYDSNNSGGRWWLSDEDWNKLVEAGWNVHWVKPDKHGYSRPFSAYDNPLAPCVFHGDDARWLGGLAMSAAKRFDDINDAIAEFELVTGQDAGDVGCNCCGPPHNFEAENEETGETKYSYSEVIRTDIRFS